MYKKMGEAGRKKRGNVCVCKKTGNGTGIQEEEEEEDQAQQTDNTRIKTTTKKQVTEQQAPLGYKRQTGGESVSIRENMCGGGEEED